MKTIFIETCIEILKKESNPTLQNIVSLAEQELFEIKQAAEQPLALDEGDGYDFTDPDQNPYLLSGEELGRTSALRQ